MWTETFLFLVVVLVVVVLIVAVSGSSTQIVNNTKLVRATLNGSASNVFIEVPTTRFNLVPRPTGSMVRITNNTADTVKLHNNAGVADNSELTTNSSLAAYETTLCINQNGLSTGTGTAGSWLCSVGQSIH